MNWLKVAAVAIGALIAFFIIGSVIHLITAILGWVLVLALVALVCGWVHGWRVDRRGRADRTETAAYS